MNLVWTCQPFDALTILQLYQALRLRSEVFVVEQECVFLDTDGLDLQAWHLMAHDEGGELQAYARLLPAGVKAVEPVIGRVITAATARGTGLGHELMRKALLECGRLWPAQALSLSAQARLQAFYAGHGFAPVGAEYIEDGIPHIDMRRGAMQVAAS
jgi:ElaA protein